MGVDTLSAWFEANRDGLLIGLIVAVVIVAVMLVARELGRRAVRRDPQGWGWRSVIGRVLAKTSIAFMVLAAADVVSAMPSCRTRSRDCSTSCSSSPLRSRAQFGDAS